MAKNKLRTKHNKKRNTAFLYEILVRELTKAVISKNEAKKEVIKKTVKEFFGQGSELQKELELYKTISETRNVESDFAEKVLQEAKKEYESLNKKKIYESHNLVFNQGQ